MAIVTGARDSAAPLQARSVAILESSSQMGGIQHTTLALATRLNRASWKPIVICPEEGDLSRSCRSAGVEVRILRPFPMYSTSVWVGNTAKVPNPFAWVWNTISIWTTAAKMANFLKTLRPDLVLTKGLLCHFYGGLAAHITHIPCLWYVQDFISQRFRGIYTKVFGLMARFVPTAVAVIGPQILRQLPRGVHTRAHVIYNAVDPAKFHTSTERTRVRNSLGVSPDVTLIGNAARLTPWKGQHHLLAAFALIAPALPKAKLLLIGGSLFGDREYEHALRRTVHDLGLDGRVIFAGHRNDMADMFAAMDVFAYCAVEKDICPLSLLEAMSAALPIAAFDIPGVREAIVHRKEGVLVPIGDINALAAALLELSGNAELSRSLGESARQRVELQFCLDQHVVQMEYVFGEVLKTA